MLTDLQTLLIVNKTSLSLSLSLSPPPPPPQPILKELAGIPNRITTVLGPTSTGTLVPGFTVALNRAGAGMAYLQISESLIGVVVYHCRTE